jgi:hypothetical protein
MRRVTVAAVADGKRTLTKAYMFMQSGRRSLNRPDSSD